MQDKQLLYNSAKEAMNMAYVPYSKFKVGAALKTTDGKIYQGCNIENSSFGLTNCAERTAFFKAISEGVYNFESLLVIGDTETGCSPCGACRQVMAEFLTKDTPIYLANTQGLIEDYTLKELLPHAFTKEDM